MRSSRPPSFIPFSPSFLISEDHWICKFVQFLVKKIIIIALLIFNPWNKFIKLFVCLVIAKDHLMRNASPRTTKLGTHTIQFWLFHVRPRTKCIFYKIFFYVIVHLLCLIWKDLIFKKTDAYRRAFIQFNSY